MILALGSAAFGLSHGVGGGVLLEIFFAHKRCLCDMVWVKDDENRWILMGRNGWDGKGERRIVLGMDRDILL